MRVFPEKLDAQLTQQLLPVYLVSGDEPLQVEECCDAIRKAARDAGFTTREVIEAGSGFDWQQLAAEAAAFSLFAEKKIIDLRLPNGKPGAEGSRVLSAYCADPPPDTVLLLKLPRLERQQQNSKWYKALDGIGAIIQVWPIDSQRLTTWIEQRMRKAGMRPTPDAVRALAERVEGNLLAARQEIDKLVLLHGPGELNGEQLNAAVADSARYDPFELVDTALRGDAARCIHILDGLRGEGVPPARVLWAIHREIRQLARIATDQARGMGVDQAIQRARVFPKRTALVKTGVARLRAGEWLQLLDDCRGVDLAIKGLSPVQPWLLLESITRAMCGTHPRPPQARSDRRRGDAS